jgi:MSHA type pilus biogenesis protein MshL
MGVCKKMKTKKIVMILVLLSYTACAAVQQTKEMKNKNSWIEKEAPYASSLQNSMLSEIHEPQVPEFLPVKEDSSPFKNRTISIIARNTPLRDVLYTVAETASLNLVMERGVEPDLPLTMTVKDIAVEDALNIIFDSVDYFYLIKDNVLIVRATGTEIFELGQPNVIQEYTSDVGGDILSGIASDGENGNITGEITMKTSSDKTTFRFWETMERTLTNLLHAKPDDRGSALQPRFIINRMTGTIMVTAAKKDLNKVRNYITTLKKVLNRQVLIEARIVEVQLSEGLEYGIDWTAVGEWLGVGTITMGTRFFTNVISIGEPRFEFGITENDNLTLILKALEEQGEVKTLSNPRVNIMNGQTSMLSVGRNTTFISRVETTTTVSEGSAPIISFSVDTDSILSGIIFGLVPYINSEGEITLTITPIVSNLIDLEAETIGSGNNSVEIKLPTVDLRELSTTVKVMDGQMVIIGGLISKRENLKEDKVPIISGIPFIGDAFKSVNKTYDNKELVIMLIPRIIS